MPKSERSGQVTFKGWILSGCKEEVLVSFSDTSQLHLYIYQQNICRKINNSAHHRSFMQNTRYVHVPKIKLALLFFHLSNLKCFPFFLYCRISKISTRCVTPSCHCHRPDIACTVAPTSSDIKDRMSVTGACSFSDFPHCCFRHK